ncbi:MAG: asparagine synthase-related protein [Pseudomonadota bacterium]
MSALFGYVRPDGVPEGEGLLARMRVALAGPFDEAGGLWTDVMAGMGTRRLARRPATNRPMTCARTGLVFAADARIDNRAELCSELKAAGVVLEEEDDAGLLFAAWRRWDVSALTRIAGAFAFAAWAPQTRRLVLGRSAIVGPPLHYHEAGDGLAFATMPRGLFALPWVDRRLDRHTLAMNLIRLSGEDHVTLFAGIRRLPTGCVLEKEGRLPAKVRRWWEVDLSRPLPTGSLADHAVALRDLLARVVDEQMPQAEPAALMLSGGLDSAGIAALAVRARPHVLAFTHITAPGAGVPPEGWRADESTLVQDLASSSTGLDSRILPFESGYPLDGADDMVRAQERHFSNIGNLDWMITALKAARESGAGVMLTGMQGNLTASRAGGAPFLAALAARDWPGLVREFSVRRARSAGWLLLPEPLRRRMLMFRGHPFAATARPWRDHHPVHPAFADAQELDAAGPVWFSTYMPPPQADERYRMLYLLQRQDIGLVDHAFTHLTGVEWRHPLADRRVAEFCLQLPNRLFHHQGEPRTMMREMLRGLLPESIRTSRIRGLQGYDMMARLKAHPGQLMADLERLDQNALACEALDLGRMRRCAEDLLADRAAPISILVGGLTMGRFLCWLEEEGVR